MANLEDHPYYVVQYTLWPTTEDAKAANGGLGRHTTSSHYHATGKLDAINAAAYHVRGRKSHYELAWIEGVWGPFEDLSGAFEKEVDL